jgi:hypothetical protein
MRFTWWAKDLANAVAMADEVQWRLHSADASTARMPEVTVARMAALLGDGDPDF